MYAVEGAYNYGRKEKLTEGWRAKEKNYSIVLGGGVHIVDLLLWLAQSPIISVTAYANHIALADTPFNSNDYVKATVQFASGLIGDITCNFGCVFPHFHSLRLDGNKATFINRLEYGELTTSPDAAVPPQKIMVDYPGDKGKLNHQFSFLDAILKGTALLVTVDQIFADLAVCFAIEESVTSGKTVRVRPL
jgi:predicted dehydrogenase